MTPLSTVGTRAPGTDPGRSSAADTPRALKVFLCHASEDDAAVYTLYTRLKASGIDPWLDDEALLPGQDWDFEIRNAVRETDAVLVCLSQRSVSKEGYVQKEILNVLDIAKEKPEGTIFVVPVHLEPCALPRRLSTWQAVSLDDGRGYERLIRALQVRAESLGRRLPLSP
jgi:hypothetical protein